MKKSYTKDHLDRFYTDEKVAKELIKEVDVHAYELVVEPSAGNGSFSKNIKKCLAFDISPAI